MTSLHAGVQPSCYSTAKSSSSSSGPARSVPAPLDHVSAVANSAAMSQDSRTSKGKAPMRRNADADAPVGDSQTPSRPDYMTVVTGSTSEHASRLLDLLDADSGYGDSIASENFQAARPELSGNRAMMHHDRPQAGVLHQMWYNSQRAKLGRSINKVMEMLQSLREMNTSWPAHYPSVQQVSSSASSERPRSRRGITHTHSMMADVGSPSPAADHPPTLRRSMIVVEDSSTESNRAAESRSALEPRLVTPQIAHEFSILKLDLKLGSLHQAELVHSLEKGSIASLVDGKITSSIKHLISLRERIEDTSSKVLITGDLNAGKSTFCNALLRRKVLPEDQQPCTAIFCEVLDARANASIEEVHAVHREVTYNRNDESTFDVFSLKDLEKIVIDNEVYAQCKVYVKDIRTIDESLLNNGVVDIALIDAPGLNSDTTKTTAIFARQEEIDVVVFVVSAANHFTQSAKEFIWAAAAEKAYLFIVVNGYDAIKDKERCHKLILEQISGLSPRTHKEASELVHFVSSNAIRAGPSTPGGSGGGGSGSASGGGGGDDPGDDFGRGKGKDQDKVRDFEALEQSLRRFVLEKRARSKLAPARTYLLNILNDVNILATVNQDIAQSESERVSSELKVLEPQLESGRKAISEVGDQIDQDVEDKCREVYNHTRAELKAAISQAGNSHYDLAYPGVFSAFQYADDLKDAMLSHIADAVCDCEEYARSKAVQGVNIIKQLGLLHVGDEFQNLHFRADIMFRRKRDALARQVDVSTELWDFVDWSAIAQRQEKLAGTGMALTVAGAVVPRMIGMSTWMEPALAATRLLGSDNIRRLMIPGIIVAAIAASAYVLQQIPNSLPPRLAAKISAQLAKLDYVHSNSTRISASVRKVLRFPANSLRSGLEKSVRDLGNRLDETVKVKGESERAAKYFRELVGESEVQRSMVEAVDLDAPPPGFH